MITHGIILLDKNSNHETRASMVTTRKFDVELYERTGELKYLDEEGEIMPTNTEVVNAKKMRTEIDTLAKFEEIGNTTAVANRYSVAPSTAHGLKMSLRAKGEAITKQATTSVEGKEGATLPLEQAGMNDYPNNIKQGPESVITETKDSVPTCFGNYKFSGSNCLPNVCEKSEECFRATENPCKETIDDLAGLVEPEPSWNYVPKVGFNLSDKALNELAKELKKPVNEDEIWRGIELDLKLLHSLAIQKINDRLRGILEGVGC